MVEVYAAGLDLSFDSHDLSPFCVVVVSSPFMAIEAAHRMKSDDAITVGTGEPSGRASRPAAYCGASTRSPEMVTMNRTVLVPRALRLSSISTGLPGST